MFNGFYYYSDFFGVSERTFHDYAEFIIFAGVNLNSCDMWNKLFFIIFKIKSWLIKLQNPWIDYNKSNNNTKNGKILKDI